MSQPPQFILLNDVRAGTTIGSIGIGSSSLSPFSFITAALVAVVSGAVVGLLLMFSSWFFYLYCIQPGIAAFLVALAVQFSIRVGKMRHGRSALLIGLLAAIVMYGTYRVGVYLDFLRLARSEILSTEPNAQDEDINLFINEILREQTGMTGFPGFVHLEAQEGLSVSFTVRGNSTGELLRTNVFFTYVYWIGEILLVLLVIVLLSNDAALKPYCIATGKWLDVKKAGHVPEAELENFLAAINAGNYEQAAQYVDAKTSSPITVEVAMCSLEAEEGLLQVTYSAGRDTKDIIDTTIVPGELTRQIQQHTSI